MILSSKRNFEIRRRSAYLRLKKERNTDKQQTGEIIYSNCWRCAEAAFPRSGGVWRHDLTVAEKEDTCGTQDWGTRRRKTKQNKVARTTSTRPRWTGRRALAPPLN
ncbi:hypothetical protein KCP78_08055 [Salmonella enterica subsp. enterica]|nr:hypothetical protein KCP78_08055 [Salmonella enterica subsp. enterica]